jgi:hypothetical protein
MLGLKTNEAIEGMQQKINELQELKKRFERTN